MRIHTAFGIDGTPVFGSWAGRMAELEAVRDAGMNLIVSGGATVDTSREVGRFCRDHGIKVMYSLTGQIHGRPRLTRDISAEETEIPITDGNLPVKSGLVQIEDELIRYRDATDSLLLGCERGWNGTTAAAHESAIILFWPELAAEEIERVKDSPSLWGYWVLDDSPGYARPALLALNRLIKRIDGTEHAVCAGHSGVGTLRNFAPGTCDILVFYYYRFAREGYRRTLNSISAQWTLTEARRQVPGIPFFGVFQGFWERSESDRRLNTADPLEPWQIREQIEDFVRDGASGILTWGTMEDHPEFFGWNSRPELVRELCAIRDEIAATGSLHVPPEPEELASIRIQPTGFWENPRSVPGTVPAWYIIGPFDARERGIAEVFPPEHVFDLNARYPAKGTPARWKVYRATAGAVGLVETFGSPHFCEGCTAYAVCTVTSDREQRVQIRFGSDDDAVVWFNGVEVWRFEGGRGVVPDSDVVPVTLPAGDTRLLVKVYNRRDQWGFFMRFTDVDGRPLEGLRFSPSGP